MRNTGSLLDSRMRWTCWRYVAIPNVGETRWIQIGAQKEHADLRMSRVWLTRIASLKERLSLRGITQQNEDDLVRGLARSRARLKTLEKVGPSNYWYASSLETKKVQWEKLMLLHLATAAEPALAFLRTVLSSYTPPAYQISDALDLIAGMMPRTKQMYTMFWTTLQKVDRTYMYRPSYTKQTLLLVLELRSIAGAVEVWEWLRRSEGQLSHRILNQSAGLLAAAGQFNNSADLIGRVLRDENGVNSHAVAGVMTRILKSMRALHGDYTAITSLVSSVLGHNVPLDVPFYNELISHAASIGDPVTVWQLWDTMISNDLEPDYHTWIIMFRMCRKIDYKAGKSSYVHLRKRLHSMNNDKLENPLLTELLACQRHFAKEPDVMPGVDIYCQLQEIQLLNQKETPSNGSSLEISHSGPYATYPASAPLLGAMAAKSIRHASSLPTARRKLVLEGLYRSFRSGMEKGDAVVVKLASSDYIHNAFAKAFGKVGTVLRHRKRSSLVYRHRKLSDLTYSTHWVDVVEAMGKNFPRLTIDRVRGQASKTPKPTLQTWNIILSSYATRGQEAGTKIVLQRMRRQGIKPDLVTWNSLVQGFSKSQRGHAVADVLKSMKDAGIMADEFTARALSHLKDKHSVLKQVQRRSVRSPPALRFVQTRYPAEP